MVTKTPKTLSPNAQKARRPTHKLHTETLVWDSSPAVKQSPANSRQLGPIFFFFAFSSIGDFEANMPPHHHPSPLPPSASRFACIQKTVDWFATNSRVILEPEQGSSRTLQGFSLPPLLWSNQLSKVSRLGKFKAECKMIADFKFRGSRDGGPVALCGQRRQSETQLFDSRNYSPEFSLAVKASCVSIPKFRSAYSQSESLTFAGANNFSKTRV